MFAELFACSEAHRSVLDTDLTYVQILYILYFGKCLLLMEQKIDPNRRLGLISSELKGKHLMCTELRPRLTCFYDIFNWHFSV